MVPVRRIAGDSWKLSRSLNNSVACPSVAEYGNTHRSWGTPSASAFSADVTMMAPPKSTKELAFIDFVYGSPTMRLLGEGVTISSAVIGVRTHACGFATATALKSAHSSPITARCSSRPRPAAARTADSNSG